MEILTKEQIYEALKNETVVNITVEAMQEAKDRQWSYYAKGWLNSPDYDFENGFIVYDIESNGVWVRGVNEEGGFKVSFTDLIPFQ